MSNPLINRWGLNLFWYNFWYRDKNQFFNNHRDLILNKITNIFINYGVTLEQNNFINKYWYLNYKNINSLTNIITFTKNLNQKYFRIFQHKNRLTEEITFFYKRNKLKNIYFSKIWIFSYQNWIILFFLAFKSLKKKKKKKKKLISSLFFNNNQNKNNLNQFFIFRVKLQLILLLKNFFFLKNTYYLF